MKIYTKTGDAGDTGLYRGGRVPKDAPRINAYGTVDELNSQIGWVRTLALDSETDALLGRVQNDLFVIGADLSTPPEAVNEGDVVMRLPAEAQHYLEESIDRIEAVLTPLRQFIIPGGSSEAAGLHVARSICRRAEREVVALGRRETVNPAVVVYLNRLSDCLFMLARDQNHRQGRDDIPWEKTGGS